MRLLDILPRYEIKKFDAPVVLTREDQLDLFSIDMHLKHQLYKIKLETNKIGFLLQYVYFIRNNRFFVSGRFYKKDIEFAAKKLGIVTFQNIHKEYKDRVRQQHRKQILKLLGYSSYLESKEEIDNLISQKVAKQVHPRKILTSMLEALHNKKIEIPSYDYLARKITIQYSKFEKDILSKIASNITPDQKEALNELLLTIKGDYQRPLVTRLKHLNHSTRPAKIKHGIRNYLIIKKLFLEIKSLTDKIDLSNEAIQYYAKWLIKAQSYQTISMTEENKRYLHLLAFINYYYKIWQDLLIDILLKSVQQQMNRLEKMNTDLIKDDLPEKNKLTKSVLSGFQEAHLKIAAVKDILYDKELDNTKKVELLYKIIPQLKAEDKELKTVSEVAIEAAIKLNEQINKEDQEIPRMDILTKLSRKLQNRVADIVRYVHFSENAQNKDLLEAVLFYQRNTILTRSAPIGFLSNIEYDLIFNSGKFNVSLYKSLLFCKLASSIKSGEISLDHSYRYLTLDSYLIDITEWTKDKKNIIEEYGLKEMEEIKTILENLSDEIDTNYSKVNEKIINGDNKYVKTGKDGKIIVYTPPVPKPDYESILEIIGSDRYIQILSIMSDVNKAINFTTHFKHHKVKHSKDKPKEIIFFAGIFALSSCIGAHKLANTSVGINYNTLINCLNWYFSLENLHTVNQELVKFMKKLSLPNKFIKDKESLHTSNDAQKENVSAESLNADFSYKYHGNGKGINICRFIDERGILFHTNVFGSAERDAAYVIDGLCNNNEIYSDIHSTDTLGYTEMVFAISHLIDVKFAPRIKDLASQNLVSFGQIKKDLKKLSAPVIPSYYVKKDKIIENWDLVLRLIATIKRGEYKPSVILKRLGSYPKQHPLQAALKEFGKIIKSKFILEYIDDVKLRQAIEKQLNKGELANKFASAVSFASDSIPHSYIEDQEVFAMCQTIIQNIIILWNYLELTKIIMRLDTATQQALLKNITSASILTWQHVNMHGTYDFTNIANDNDKEVNYEEVINYKIA